MHVFKRFTIKDKIRDLTPKELELGLRIFQTNLGYKPGESVLIVTDMTYHKKEASIWFESAKTLPNIQQVDKIVLEGMHHSGEEPPEEVIQACAQADIIILHTFHSLTHTGAKKALLENQRRGFSLPGVDYKIMLNTLNMDYEPVRALGVLLKQSMEQAHEITITSPHGTQLQAHVRKNHVIADIGFSQNKGEFGNLPAGEVFFSPPLESTNGTWVVNGAMADVEDEGMDEPIIITINNGLAVAITGGQAAKRLEAALEAVGPLAFNVAEIGVGINKKASPFAKLIEAEKAYATAHLALGNSSSFGGSINVPIHLDGLTLEPTIKLDGEIILEAGEFHLV